MRAIARLLDYRTALLLPVSLFVGGLAMIPPFYLLWSSFKPISLGNIADFSLGNFTLQNYIYAFSDPIMFTTLVDSFLFAAGSMAVALLFGGVIAFLVERTNVPMRNVTYGLMLIPLIMPSMLKAIGWILLMNPNNGILNNLWFAMGFEEPLFNAYSIPAMYWVEGLSMSPLTFLLMGAALRGMDPSLEEAALTSGAGKFLTFFRVTFKLMTPAIAGVGLLQFIRGLEAFEVPLVMGMSQGIHVFSTNIYVSVKEISPPEYGFGFVLSLVLTLFAIIGLLVYQRAIAKSGRYATVTGKGFRPRIIDLGKWRLAAGGFILFFIFVSMILPFLVLLWASLLPFYQPPSMAAAAHMGLKNYQELFAQDMFYQSLKNTMILATTVSVGGMLLATLVSWIVIRLKPKGGTILDTLAFLPYAVPGIAMGYSFMIFFLAFPNPIYGTLWILILAYLVNFLPIATRFTHAGIAQIRAELEEAATTSGAGLLMVIRRIVLPLILPSLLAGGLYIFILSIKVLSMAAILWQPDSIILPVYLMQVWGNGTIPQVGALSVVMIVIITVLTITARFLGQRRSYIQET